MNESKFFLPYQAAWIKDDSAIKIMEKARQTGMSWASAYRAVVTTAEKGRYYDTWVSSRDEIQAQLFGHDCARFARLLSVAAEDLQERVLDVERKITAHVLPFANQRAINSMSSNPNAQAGKRGTRILDEFALHVDPRTLYAIAQPGMMWGGNMEMISTHRGTNNFFNQLVREVKEKGNPKKISLHTVTIVKAVEQGLLEKLKTKWPKEDPRQLLDRDGFLQYLRDQCADVESWKQEYLCEPSDDASAFLGYDQIDGCKYPTILGADGKPARYWEIDLAEAKDLYIGVDVGRTSDLTAIKIIEKRDGLKFVRRMIEMKNVSFSAQEAVLYPLIALPNVRRVCIDGSGLGRQFAERAKERFGYKVEIVIFTAAVKEELAYPLRGAFEDKILRIPDDAKLVADLRSVRKETTASNNVRFAGDRGVNGHADRFWALALAVHAAKEAGGPFHYTPISRRPRDTDGAHSMARLDDIQPTINRRRNRSV